MDRKQLRIITSSLFIAAAAGLAVSALMAAPVDSEAARRAECKGWMTEAQKPIVAKAFDDVLRESALDTPEGNKLRKRLLDSTDCYKEPKAAVQERLGNTITFPPKARVIFYENEDGPAGKLAERPFSGPPSEQCLHILALGEVGREFDKASFKENLMCCYKPW